MTAYYIPGVTEVGPAYDYATDPGAPFELYVPMSTTPKATKATEQAAAPENEV